MRKLGHGATTGVARGQTFFVTLLSKYMDQYEGCKE